MLDDYGRPMLSEVLIVGVVTGTPFVVGVLTEYGIRAGISARRRNDGSRGRAEGLALGRSWRDRP